MYVNKINGYKYVKINLDCLEAKKKQCFSVMYHGCSMIIEVCKYTNNKNTKWNIIDNLTGVCWLMLYPATMHDLMVDVSPRNNLVKTRCGLARGNAKPGDVKYIRCDTGCEGSVVTVTAPGPRQKLSINEVQVYGQEGELTTWMFPVETRVVPWL